MQITPLESWITRKIGVSQLTKENLASYQKDAFQKIVSCAIENSSFYREFYQGHNIEDLPLIDESHLRQYGKKMLCLPQEKIQRIVTLHTSGTTNEAKRIYFSQNDLELTVDFFHHGMSTLIGPGSRVLILLPGQRPGSVGDLLSLALERLGAFPYLCPSQEPWAIARFMAEKQISCIVGSPVQALALTPWSRGHYLESALLSTDYVPDSLTHTLESTWNCRVFQHYSLTESGLGGGVSCRAHRGYHLREADLLFEIIDPKTGKVIHDERLGEIVLTTLTREAMPLIRYRTGDTGQWLISPCSCGSVLKTLDKVGPRRASVFSLPGGSLDITQTDEALFALPGLLDYRLTLEDTVKLSIYSLQKLETNLIKQALRLIPTLSDLPIQIDFIVPTILPSLKKRQLVFINLS